MAPLADDPNEVDNVKNSEELSNERDFAIDNIKAGVVVVTKIFVEVYVQNEGIKVYPED